MSNTLNLSDEMVAVVHASLAFVQARASKTQKAKLAAGTDDYEVSFEDAYDLFSGVEQEMISRRASQEGQ